MVGILQTSFGSNTQHMLSPAQIRFQIALNNSLYNVVKIGVKLPSRDRIGVINIGINGPYSDGSAINRQGGIFNCIIYFTYRIVSHRGKRTRDTEDLFLVAWDLISSSLSGRDWPFLLLLTSDWLADIHYEYLLKFPVSR